MTSLAAPLYFPIEEKVPETKLHLELRTALYQILQLAFADRAWIGCDQFVYWVATDPRQCLAPDAFVKFGGPDELFQIWKTWERGVMELAVEIVSPTDKRRWAEKLADYEALGVRELVRFDPERAAGTRIEAWDRSGDRLVPRVIVGEVSESRVLAGLTWVVSPVETFAALRLMDENQRLLPTPGEVATAANERATAAERRIAELEAELARRGK